MKRGRAMMAWAVFPTDSLLLKLSGLGATFLS